MGKVIYSTRISFDDPPPDFGDDAFVRVDIEVAELHDVLTVPEDTVAFLQGKSHVAVKKASGGIEWREVVLGLRGGGSIEVKQGLKSGDAVVRESARLLTVADRVRVRSPRGNKSRAE